MTAALAQINHHQAHTLEQETSRRSNFSGHSHPLHATAHAPCQLARLTLPCSLDCLRRLLLRLQQPIDPLLVGHACRSAASLPWGVARFKTGVGVYTPPYL
eukprot:749217-Hanusia_phi.AAC.1